MIAAISWAAIPLLFYGFFLHLGNNGVAMRIEGEEDHRSGEENAVAPPSGTVDLAEDRAGESADPLPDSGSPIDIEMLVRQFHGDLYRYAYRLSGRVEDAEDLTQQAFLIAQRKISQLREGDRARGWLFAIVRSCFLKDVRRRRPTLAVDVGFDIDGVVSLVDQRTELTSEELQHALNQLTDEQRIVVTAYYFQHASYKEIAAALDIPLGTVMSRLSRAKSTLRQLLLDQNNPSLSNRSPK